MAFTGKFTYVDYEYMELSQRRKELQKETEAVESKLDHLLEENSLYG